MDNTQQSGNGKMIAIVVAVVAVLALVGFAVMSRQQTSAPQDTQMQAAPTAAMEEDTAMTEETTDGDAMTEEEGEVREIKITNQGFAFNPKEIRVKEGETVKIMFTAQGGIHDWVVDEFDAATKQIPAGQTAEVTFTADKAGEYEFYCSVGNHRAMGMVGTLIVE